MVSWPTKKDPPLLILFPYDLYFFKGSDDGFIRVWTFCEAANTLKPQLTIPVVSVFESNVHKLLYLYDV